MQIMSKVVLACHPHCCLRDSSSKVELYTRLVFVQPLLLIALLFLLPSSIILDIVIKMAN